jgi:hypothetical protein
MDYDLLNEPFELYLIGWNEDDTYPHTVTVRFDMTPSGGDDRNAILSALSSLVRP